MFVDSAGKKIVLGQKIGAGGEGAVYDAQQEGKEGAVVAKIYHAAISAEKQAKLKSMVKAQNVQLSKLTAWPLATVHKSNKSAVCGFLMPKMVKADTLHHLYSPAQRKQKYPKASWAFLVSVARNIAAAFTVIHNFDHVVGDVNPNLVFFSRDSRVKFIDCDSFQISDNEKYYFCEVGVPNFTPPELQGTSSFRGVQRFPNHDNFGLAILLFHLLLMGRHPFAGVYLGKGDLPLKKAISEYRYAYSSGASGKQMKSPPNSVTPSILPSEISMLFERAFSGTGAHIGGRPTAREWLSAIDSLQTRLRTCDNNTIHRFSASLSRCPWCVTERTTQVRFFLPTVEGETRTAFNLKHAWDKIIIVSPPITSPQIKFKAPTVTTPLPSDLIEANLKFSFKDYLKISPFFLAVVACSIQGVISEEIGLFLAILICVLVFVFKQGKFSSKRSKERQRRQLVLDHASEELTNLTKQYEEKSGAVEFSKSFKVLENAKSHYKSLKEQFDKEKHQLFNDLKYNQYRSFLRNAIIANHSIPHVGRGRTAILLSFGIESALDVSWDTIFSIKGFGEKVTEALVIWRKMIEKDFVFDPTRGVDPRDLSKLRQKYLLKQKNMEAILLGGPEQLANIKQKARRQHRILTPLITKAAKRVAKAKNNMKVF